ncbi:MAG: NfeD family protein, partial [Candidatus Thorarchaeota archaeon]
LLLFKNLELSRNPSIAIIIAFLILPLVAIFSPDLVIPPEQLVLVILGIAIGLVIILGHLGHGFDESSYVLAFLFIALNYICYKLDSSGRLNLLIVWFFFAVMALLFLYLSKTLPKGPIVGTYIGKEGTVVIGLFPEGKIKIDDEIWKARTINDPIVKGTNVTVVGQEEGLTLLVIPTDE